jgi:hypothetical protein
MSLTRRRMLTLIGGGTILAATAGAAGFVLTRTPGRALAPWASAGQSEDPRIRALSYAILAPNPHNRQPWLVELTGSDGVRLFLDPARRLPETDPFDRQLTIGLGCFLELMGVAAGDTGHAVELAVLPVTQGGPVAEARLVPGGSRDPLMGHVLTRRSCKEPFTDQPVPDDAVTALSAAADIFVAPDQVAALRDLTWEAWLTESLTPRTMQESVDLMRFGKAEIEANPDGIDLGGPMLEALMIAGVVTREAQADQNSAGYKQGVDIYRSMLMATPAYASLASDTNTRADHIAAGRQWLRLNLMTTAMGLSLHPVSQALQEYPEMAPYKARAEALLARPGQTVQMLGRLGYGPAVPATPRWPLESRIRNA